MGETAVIVDPNVPAVNVFLSREVASNNTPACTGGGAVQAGGDISSMRLARAAQAVYQPCGSQRKKRTASTALTTSHAAITSRLVVMPKYDPASSSVLRSASPR